MSTRSDDGVTLSAGVVRPVGEPRAVLLAGHAMMIDARSLDRPLGQGFASTLAARGYLVVAADFRGHGQSGTSVGRGGSWSYDDLVRQDFPALLDLARSLAPGKACLVVGHSLMGHVAAAWLGQNPDAPVAGLCAVSSNLWLRGWEPSLLGRLRKERDIAALRGFVKLFGYFPAVRLGVGSADESRGYMDQLTGTYRRGRWTSADGRVDYGEGLAKLRCPVLAVVGKGERYWCTQESVRAFFRRLPPELFSLWFVGRGDHGLTHDPGHIDIITDHRNAPLWEALGDWLDARGDSA